jgi:nucleoside-diphosphate-sugar epimerase
MRVLVVGNQGYASILAPALHEAGHDLVGLDTGYYAGCEFGNELTPVKTVRRNARDATHADIEGFEPVVHLAALSSKDPLGDLNRAPISEINNSSEVGVATLARAVL